LFILEGRVRFRRGERAEAISVARAGIASATTAGNDAIRLDLLHFLGDALWLNDDRTTARATLGEAVAVADRLPDPTRSIDALARFLRFGRALDVPSSDDAQRRADLGTRIKRISRPGLEANSQLARQAAVEVLPEDPEAFRFVDSVVGILGSDLELTQESMNRLREHLPEWLTSYEDVRHVLQSIHPTLAREKGSQWPASSDLIGKLDTEGWPTTVSVLRSLVGSSLLTAPDFIADLRVILERPLPDASGILP